LSYMYRNPYVFKIGEKGKRGWFSGLIFRVDLAPWRFETLRVRDFRKTCLSVMV
jgi:hypothetical protein